MQTKTDAELLGIYVRDGDSAAFAELVARHGPMVYRVCLHKLGNPHDAEDASQAVFMALVRQAPRLRMEGCMAGWFHAVARQTALFLARSRARRVQREAEAGLPEGMPERFVSEPDREAMLDVVNEELSALSAVQREAVILRYLAGHSERAAAALVGCAPNTLSCRAADGMAKLRTRLARRGFAIGAAGVVIAMEADLQAAVPATLIPSLLAAPEMLAADSAATGAGNIVALMNGAMKGMVMAKVKTVGMGIAAILLATGLGTGTFLYLRENSTTSRGEVKTAPGVPPKAEVLSVPDIRSAPRRSAHTGEDYRAKAEQELKSEDWEALAKILEDWSRHAPQEAAEWVMGLKLGDAVKTALLGIAIANWVQDDPASTAAWIQALPKGHIRDKAFQKLALAWAEKEPVAASQWARALEDGKARDLAWCGVALSWADRDPEAASVWVQGLPDSRARNTALDMVSMALVLADPEAAVALASVIPAGLDRIAAYQRLAVLWAKTDPAAASKWALESPQRRPPDILALIAEEWANQDPLAAIKWANELPEGDARNRSLVAAIIGAAKTAPELASEMLFNIPREGDRFIALSQVANSWSAKDPEAAARWANDVARKGMPGADDALAEVLCKVASALARKDPEAALHWGEQLPQGSGQDKALLGAVLAWAKADPEAALKWVSQRPEGDSRNRLVKMLVYNEMTFNLEAAKRWATLLPDDSGQTKELLAQTKPRLARLGLPSSPAEKWASRYSAGDPQDALLTLATAQWGGIDPVKAPELAQEWTKGGDPAKPDEAMHQIATAWAQRDPVSAANWVLTFPETGARDNALSRVASLWAAYDPLAATTWATQLPDGKARNTAASSAAWQWMRKDPATAGKWAMQIPDGTDRTAALSAVADNIDIWAKRDNQAAADWVLHLPQGDPARDEALSTVACYCGSDPAFGVDLATWIQDTATRKDAFSTIINNVLSGSGKAETRKWVETSTFSEDTKQVLLNHVEDWKSE